MRPGTRGLLAADSSVGNEVTLSGEPADVALADASFPNDRGRRPRPPVTPEAVRHGVAILTGTEDESPAEVLTLDILSRRARRFGPRPSTRSAMSTHRRPHHRVRRWAAGTGKTYWRWPRRSTPSGETGQPDHPDPSRGGSRRTRWFPARHAEVKIDPICGRLRRTARHDGSRADPKADERRGY